MPGERKQVPEVVRHCIAALEGDMPTDQKFAICVAQMQKSGYLKPGSMQLTASGKGREGAHVKEPEAASKTQDYEAELASARKARQEEQAMETLTDPLEEATKDDGYSHFATAIEHAVMTDKTLKSAWDLITNHADVPEEARLKIVRRIGYVVQGMLRKEVPVLLQHVVKAHTNRKAEAKAKAKANLADLKAMKTPAATPEGGGAVGASGAGGGQQPSGPAQSSGQPIISSLAKESKLEDIRSLLAECACEDMPAPAPHQKKVLRVKTRITSEGDGSEDTSFAEATAELEEMVKSVRYQHPTEKRKSEMPENPAVKAMDQLKRRKLGGIQVSSTDPSSEPSLEEARTRFGRGTVRMWKKRGKKIAMVKVGQPSEWVIKSKQSHAES